MDPKVRKLRDGISNLNYASSSSFRTMPLFIAINASLYRFHSDPSEIVKNQFLLRKNENSTQYIHYNAEERNRHVEKMYLLITIY